MGRKQKRGPSVLALVLVCSLPSVAKAELYSWVDDEGVIHLTNIREKAKDGPFKRYGAADSAKTGQIREEEEGFGGAEVVVRTLPNGGERVFYPVDVKAFDDIIREAAEHYNLPFEFVKAVAKVESNFNPRAISPKDAKGLMQLIDATAADMSVTNPFDPRENIYGGARYLRILANMFDGNMALTAAAYNAGPDRVLKVKRIPNIRETQRYVRRVLTMYRHYRRTGAT